MKKDTNQLNIEKIIKSEILSKFPLLGVTLNSSKFIMSDKVETIETNGTDIIYNPSYINSLSFDKQVFEFSHNLMHIQFNHISRSKGKDATTWNYSTDAVINQILKKEGLSIDGVDIADAMNKSAEEIYTQLMSAKQSKLKGINNNQQSINNTASGKGKNSHSIPRPNDNNQGNNNESQQNSNSSSKKDGKEGSDKNQSSSTLQEPNNTQQKENSQSNNQNNSQDNSQHSSSGSSSGESSQNTDEEFFQNYPEDGYGNGQSSASANGVSSELLEDYQNYENNGSSQQHSNWNGQARKMNIFQKIMDLLSKKQNEQPEQNEQQFVSDNNNLKNEQLQNLTDYLKGKKESKNAEGSLKTLQESKSIEDFMDPVEPGYVPIVDWKKYLKRNKERRRDEKLEYTWTRRRANEDSYWQSRLERKKILRVREEDELKPITLVAIDTSPSISDELLKGFVNQFSELSKESRIFVGCFYDHFCGFKELKADKNGQLYIHLDRGWGTDLDSACRSFKYFEQSHKDLKILNRVIFTDGDYANGTKPGRDLWNTDCLWLIFDYPGEFKCCCGKVLQFKSKDLMKDIKNENKFSPTQDDDRITLT